MQDRVCCVTCGSMAMALYTFASCVKGAITSDTVEFANVGVAIKSALLTMPCQCKCVYMFKIVQGWHYKFK
jgi:hypothetical protein